MKEAAFATPLSGILKQVLHDVLPPLGGVFAHK
jgi:hypothetical protein